jgi:threonine/homoserine/homoserine lactone efflux protein
MTMENLIFLLLPYIVGSAVVPVQIIIGLLLLKSPEQGLRKAIAYVGGMSLTRLLQGFLFGLVLIRSSTAPGTGSGKGPIISTLLIVLGILLLIAAYKKWSGEEDPDAPPPKWLVRLDQIAPAKAFSIGFAIPLISAKLWVFLLSALTTIAAAESGLTESVVAFSLFIILAQSLLLIPILLRIVLPERSEKALAQLSEWLIKNNRPIGIVVSLVFGVFFLYSGISSLQS